MRYEIYIEETDTADSFRSKAEAEKSLRLDHGVSAAAIASIEWQPKFDDEDGSPLDVVGFFAVI